MKSFFAFVLMLFISNATFATDGIICAGTVDEIGLHATVVTGTACNNFTPWELASIRFLYINK